MGWKKWGVVLSVLISLSFSSVLWAQQRPVANYLSRGAQYVIGNQDQLLIRVNIWGFVKMPGQYLVPTNTDLVSLISYAGGPLEDAQLKKIRLIRTAMRDSSEKIISLNVKKFIDAGDESQNPQLLPNDTIIVTATSYHWVIKSLEFVSKLGSIAYFSYFAVRLIQNK
ncbi:MAG: hypothetical protein GXO76_07160 [Calditrichaeota bacterium]|nr:hypothetical protein [Calditrichota bacterium]